MKARLSTAFLVFVLVAAFAIPTAAASAKYDINTLAGKVASLNGTAGLQTRFSALIEVEAEEEDASSPNAISPAYVLSSPLDGNSIQAPDVLVNQDTAAASQNETAIAVDPNNPNRVVAAANDYVSRTWTCTVSGTPCSALGDGYSGTYYSNDGGAHWNGGPATDPQHLGTLIPGVTRLTGGQYDAGGDPALAFDSRGNVYYAGLGFNRNSAPNTVAVNKGTFNGGQLSWSAPVFINPTTSPAVLNDKEWIGADWHVSSPFRDRVYVSWTRYIFNAKNGAFVQAPIFFVYSKDGGKTFSTPQNISGNVLYDQGSRPVVGYDGTLYVFFEGSTRLAALSSTYMVKSTDGGVTFSKPVAVSTLADLVPLANAAFRVNSFPAADVAPNGDLYVAWSSEVPDDNSTFAGTNGCAYFISGTTAVYNNCHSEAVYSKSTDGGTTWSAPAPIFPALNASNQTPIGYPVTNPDNTVLNAPSAHRVESLWPGVAISPSGRVYMSAYAADVVSPWQTCASAPPSPENRVNCYQLGNYIHNARLDYYVTNPGAGTTQMVTSNPINTRYHFGGGFIGDYTDLAVGSDNVFHALWTDTNNVQTVVWWYGLEFTPTQVHQQDVVTAKGNF